MAHRAITISIYPYNIRITVCFCNYILVSTYYFRPFSLLFLKFSLYIKKQNIYKNCIRLIYSMTTVERITECNRLRYNSYNILTKLIPVVIYNVVCLDNKEAYECHLSLQNF